MRTPLIRAVALAATLLAPLALQAPLAQVPGPRIAQAGAPARVIVKLRADSVLMRAQIQSVEAQKTMRTQALGLRIGVDLVAGHVVSERSHVVIARGMTSTELAAKLSAQPDVEYAVVEGRKRIVGVPSDPFYGSRPVGTTSGGPAVGQWYLKPQGASGTAANTAPSAINAEQAWDITTGNSNIVVADLDTGVRFDHPDLQGGNVVQGYDMVSADDAVNGMGGTNFASAGDGDGRDPDASDPGDFVTAQEAAAIGGGCQATPSSSWHGTQTLGLIGATTDNRIGIAGVARNVKVMPVRVLGKCGGSDGDVIAGMLWAAGITVPGSGLPVNQNKARVLNMSLGESGVACNAAFQDAISQVNAAGAVVVVAAGNDSGVAVGSPANCAGVITVAAVRSVGDKNGFSNLGSNVTISAPGGNCVTTTPGAPCLYPIMTTTNAGTTTPVAGAAGGTYSDAFDYSIGTSFSTPLVSGVVALMLSLQPALTPAQVKSKLQATARPFPTTGGTISIATTTVSPTALSPVALQAKEPLQCTAPSTTEQAECYCTTDTCGAGMLDAFAAVTGTVGGGPGASIRTVAFHWSLVNGGGIVSAINGADMASPSVTPSGPGTFSVSLTSTDSAGVTSTTSTSVTVAAAPVVVAPAPTSSGGGALGIGWLLLLVTAVLAIGTTARSEQRAHAGLSAADHPSRRR